MVVVEQAFFLVAAIIFIGYFGFMFFSKTKISETLMLLAIGLLIGPGLNLLGPTEIGVFEGFLPFFASFALMIILFEGGMQLNFFKTLRSLSGTFLFTLGVFFATLALIAAAWFVFTQDLMTGLLLGAILGGTSSEVILPLVKLTSAKEITKNLLALESALTDALCAILALAFAGVIALSAAGATGTVSFLGIGGDVIGAFSIAAVLGVVFGLVWLNVMPFFEKRQYEYLVTLAVLMLLYSVAQALGGSGAIAALVFGIVLGNSEDLTSMLRLSSRKVDQEVKSFQGEVSFLVRTLFFVYLGILFKPSYLGDTVVILMAVLIMAGIMVSRFAGAKIMAAFNKEFGEDTKFITFLNARGLSSAALISFPAIVGLGLGLAFERMVALVFIIIMLTNIASSISVFFVERSQRKRAAFRKLSLPIKDY